MNTLEILIQARQLIKEPEHWTTHLYARDKDNHEIQPSNPNASKFCAVGALCKIDNGDDSAFQILYETSKELFGTSVTAVNDILGHEAVLELYDHAICKAKQEAV